MASSEVLIEYPDGSQYSCATPEIAQQAHPEARIVRYFDGTPYETKEPTPRTTAKPKAPRPRRIKAPATVPAPDSVVPAMTAPAEIDDGAPDQA